MITTLSLMENIVSIRNFLQFEQYEFEALRELHVDFDKGGWYQLNNKKISIVCIYPESVLVRIRNMDNTEMFHLVYKIKDEKE